VTPKTTATEDLLRELEALKEDVYTLSQRHRRVLAQARETLVSGKPMAKPTEVLKT
jgi:hypothetical protein